MTQACLKRSGHLSLVQMIGSNSACAMVWKLPLEFHSRTNPSGTLLPKYLIPMHRGNTMTDPMVTSMPKFSTAPSVKTRVGFSELQNSIILGGVEFNAVLSSQIAFLSSSVNLLSAAARYALALSTASGATKALPRTVNSSNRICPLQN